jgi:putative SOS response-associated peptidase YedK
MCGRYASARDARDLASAFGVDDEAVEASGQDAAAEPLPPSWNVAPTDPVRAVLQRDDRRLLKVLRWGLVPSWAKDAKGAARLINARRETVASKPAFRAAYARRRCLLPADGYYEWQVVDGRKQPWYLTSRDGEPLAMAGLYEVWSPRRDAGPAERLWTCTVITTEAADDTGQIHDRTPLLVPRTEWGRWLDPELEDPGEHLLVPAVNGSLDAWPVGAAVGNVRNDGPELVQPVPLPSPGPVQTELGSV